jgi:hypothetical protein
MTRRISSLTMVKNGSLPVSFPNHGQENGLLLDFFGDHGQRWLIGIWHHQQQPYVFGSTLASKLHVGFWIF